MGRTILGIVAGVVVAFAAITLAENLLYALLPAGPIIVDGGGAIAALPLSLELLLGALAGAMVAGRIARRPAIGWTPAAPVALAGLARLANVATIPHPLWMSIAAILVPIAGGWIGVRLARTHPFPVMPA